MEGLRLEPNHVGNFIVLPLALVMAEVGLWAFIWSVRIGQMDDLETPAIRMLSEEEEILFRIFECSDIT